MSLPDAYQKLSSLVKELSYLGGASGLMHWDQETFMPPKGIDFRAEALSYFSGKAHELWTRPEVGDWIDACENAGVAAGSRDAANIRQWRRSYDQSTKLPKAFVEEFSKATTFGRTAWVEARKKSDFSLFEPHLSAIVDLCRRSTEYLGYSEHPYDALLEQYEEGLIRRELIPLFSELREQIVPLVAEAAELSRRVPGHMLRGHYPVAAQQAFNREVAEAIGFDFESGRIDTTAHPFCTSLGPRDQRLTTRYDETDFLSSLYGVLHEAGHGLYEAGLPAEEFGFPSGSAVSLGIHESQSRLWENHVGRTVEFWHHWYPRARHHFPDMAKYSPNEVAAVALRSSPSLIRVEADEVTYDLHIILRFELESALIGGELKVKDLPGEWNRRFTASFNLPVPDDTHGCLQDIHWSQGGIGYFPTYTLGNLNASQLMNRIAQDVPGIETQLSRGEYAPLLKWLREKIHRHGSCLKPQDLIAQATGSPTKPAHHIRHLKRKIEALRQAVG